MDFIEEKLVGHAHHVGCQVGAPHIEVTDSQRGGHEFGIMGRGQWVTDIGWKGGDLEVTDLQRERAGFC